MSLNKNIDYILRVYETILENKKILTEVSDVYDNIDFKDSGPSNPSKDDLNTNLLNDIQVAAQKASLNVSVTTGISGHESLPSRHPAGNAVDIAIINGKPVSLENRADADKFVNELVGMGYIKNQESGNEKAVLTFGFPGHDTHVHVSNTNVQGTDTSNTATTATNKTKTSDKTFSYDANLADTGISDRFKLTEQLNFGNNISSRYGNTIIPSSSNQKIKSPVSGVVNNTRYNSSCTNQVMIEFTENKKKYYIEFCGITKVLVNNGDTVSKGQKIGETTSDVEVSIYNSNMRKIDDSELSVDKTNKDDDDKNSFPRKKERTYTDPLISGLIELPFRLAAKPFENKYDKSGKLVQKRIGSPTDKREVDPWILQALKDPFGKKRKKLHNEEDEKLTENIKRIKGLL